MNPCCRCGRMPAGPWELIPDNDLCDDCWESNNEIEQEPSRDWRDDEDDYADRNEADDE